MKTTSKTNQTQGNEFNLTQSKLGKDVLLSISLVAFCGVLYCVTLVLRKESLGIYINIGRGEGF